jgi:hypothetical protein
MSRRSSAPRARLTLHIELATIDGDPPWRALTIDPSLGLASLADAILLAFGWTGTGVWRFGTTRTPWWGRDADSWGCGILTPARPPADRSHGYDEEWYGDDRYRTAEQTHRCEREWSIDQVLERFGDGLEFEYRQLDLEPGRDNAGATWRHRIVAGDLDTASSTASAPDAMLLGGAGTIPRIGAEAAYGELGDPERRAALDHELMLHFGSPASVGQPFGTPSWAPLDAAMTGSSAAARRALRMDLVELGALQPARLDVTQVEHAITPIRELLRSAAHADGVDADSNGPLGDDLRALRFARVQKGVLRTLVPVRNTLMDDPVALWYALAERLMNDGHAGPNRWAADVAERAVDLVCGDGDVRRFAFDEAHRRVWHGTHASEFGPSRLDRILTTLELIDDDGRAAHPNARAFGFAMLRGRTD